LARVDVLDLVPVTLSCARNTAEAIHGATDRQSFMVIPCQEAGSILLNRDLISTQR
jgi:hypothetical protein